MEMESVGRHSALYTSGRAPVPASMLFCSTRF